MHAGPFLQLASLCAAVFLPTITQCTVVDHMGRDLE
jgi:hypothetical protein